MRRPLARGIFVLIPAAILCLDFLYYPILFEGYQIRPDVGAVSLLTEGELELGTFRAHRIRVSMGDIRDANYLTYLNSGRSALVVSVYVGDDGEVVRGALVDAVLEELQKSAPPDAARIIDALGKRDSIHTANMLSFDLAAEGSYNKFPLKYLLIIPLRYGKPEETKEELASSFPEVFRFASEREVSTLIVPCLGTNWQNKNSITFDEFFAAFFNSLPSNRMPPDVYISFYKEWPSFYIEAGVTSLSSNWQRSFGNVYGNFSKLYRMQFRLIGLFWCVCLLLLPYSVPPTIKNFWIVSIAFVMTALGAGQLIAFLGEGMRPRSALILEAIVLASMAIWFPQIVTWTAKEVFRNEHRRK